MADMSGRLPIHISIDLGAAARDAVQPSQQVGFSPIAVGNSRTKMEPAGKTLVQGYRSGPKPPTP